MKKKRSLFLPNSLGGGVIFPLICKQFDRIRYLLTHGFFAKLATVHTAIDFPMLFSFFQKKEEGAYRLKSSLSKARRKIAGWLWQSVFVGCWDRISRSMLYQRTKTYAAFLLSFGSSVLLLSILRKYATNVTAVRSSDILLAVCAILLSVPLLVGNETIFSFARKSCLLRLIFFAFCGLSDTRFQRKNMGEKKYGAATVLGLMFGIATLLIDPLYYLIGFILFVGLTLIFHTPEAGVLLLAGAIPFMYALPHATMALAAMVLMVDMACFVKWALGTDEFSFCLLDFCVACFMLLYALGGLVSAGGMASLGSAMLSILFLSSYFLIVYMMRMTVWIRRAWKTLWVSGTVSALINLGQLTNKTVNASWVDLSLFSDMGVRITGGFDNPNVYAEYLLILLPLSLVMFFGQKEGMWKVAVGIGGAVLAVSMVFTWSRGAWLGILLALLIFVLIVYKRSPVFLFLASLLSPFATLFVPHHISSRFLSIGNFSDSSVSFRFSIWKGTWKMLTASHGCGIGVGYSAFSAVYPIFAYGGSAAVRHTHSLYLQIAAELGGAGVFVMLSTMVVFFQACFSYFSDFNDSEEKRFVAAGLSAVSGLFLMGFTDHIWYDCRMFLVFWLIVGLVMAQIRVCYTMPAHK